jgi:hygromycin-B 7''-O-kinase
VKRHGLTTEPCVRVLDGSHILFRVGKDHMVKLYCPLFPRDFPAERLTLRALRGRTSLPTPVLQAEGRLDGWPYLVMSRLPGRKLGAVWKRLELEERVRLCGEIGAFMAELRGLASDGLEGLALDWPRFVREQKGRSVTKHHHRSVPEALLRQIPDYLRTAPPLYGPGFRPVLVLSDLTDEHFLVVKRRGRWELAGCIDFGDARLGHPLYEYVSPAIDIAGGEPEPLMALLLASGLRPRDLTPSLRHRLMAYTLLHEYALLRDILQAIPALRGQKSLEGCARAIWPF